MLNAFHSRKSVNLNSYIVAFIFEKEQGQGYCGIS